MRLSFIVPGVPVPCERPRVVRGGRGQRGVRTITPARTERYQAEVCRRAAVAMYAHAVAKQPESWVAGQTGPFALTVCVYRAANRGDLSNFVKSVEDGMTRAGVWKDDRHVVRIDAWMGVDRDNPRVEVAVRVLAADGVAP